VLLGCRAEKSWSDMTAPSMKNDADVHLAISDDEDRERKKPRLEEPAEKIVVKISKVANVALRSVLKVNRRACQGPIVNFWMFSVV